MAADAVAPCVATSSVAMIFIMQGRGVPILHGEEIESFVPSESW